jgi:transcriptional regulator with XRE-family HTH domain
MGGGTGDAPTSRCSLAADFGVRMRKLRQEKGWSISELADLARTSAGQISNLETGRRSPTRAVANACDKALGADGELVALASSNRPDSRTDPRTGPRARSGIDTEVTLAAYRAVLDNLRAAGQASGPRPVLAVLAASAQTLRDIAVELDGARAGAIWLLAARFAEYSGWMSQESGNHTAALTWTDRAVAWGGRGGDGTIAAYALVRRAMISQHRGDPNASVAFAQRAAAHPAATPRIRAHAARREAHGHALLGDTHRCLASLDQCSDLLDEPTDAAIPVWGPEASGGTLRLIQASCLVRLRMFADAIDVFNTSLDGGPAQPATVAGSDNARTRFRTRQAAAYMGLGYGDIACGLLIPLLPAVQRLDSATIRTDLRHLLDEAGHHQFSASDNDVLANAAALIRRAS